MKINKTFIEPKKFTTMRIEDETVWLTIDDISYLFGKSHSTINEHILDIYAGGELIEDD